MTRLSVATLLTACATLIAELSLIRVFDALFFPNIAYVIIMAALFAFGLAGIYAVLRPLPPRQDVQPQLAKLGALQAAASLAVLPGMNALPLNLRQLTVEPATQVACLAVMYLLLVAPFFFSGLVFARLFSAHAHRIRSLYFWDLTGAGIGSVALIPFVPLIGPGGLLFWVASLALVASALYSGRRTWSTVACAVALPLFLAPVVRSPAYFDFVEHQGKRGVKLARESHMIERTIWDPISKIDVIDYDRFRYIAYDGGSQNSIYYPFDGDFARLRAGIYQELTNHFWSRAVLAAHYLKRDSGANVPEPVNRNGTRFARI